MVTPARFSLPSTRLSLSAIVSAALLTALLLPAQAPQQDMRVWTNQEGRTVTASLVEMTAGNVVLLLENGTRSTVAMGTLSKADQDYLQKVGGGKPAAGGAAAPTAPGSLTWPPGVISVDPKTIVITEGLQDAVARRYHYLTGNFEFISTAPLAGSVMADVASDFLLTEKFFAAQPWNWNPRPKKGDRFLVYMAESDPDYLALGGKGDNASDIVNDNSLIRFRSLGLKKVGARYQYDSREKEPGRITSIVAYSMLYDVGGWLETWTFLGMSNFLRFVAYQNNGSVRFSDLGTSVRKAVKDAADNKVSPDLNRMLKLMRPSKEPLSRESRARYELQLDGFLLIYYFGFLDGDGSGAALHQYYRNIFARSKRSRSPEEAAAMLAASGMERASPEEMLSKVFAGRDDAQLAAEMTEKFKTIGVRFGK